MKIVCGPAGFHFDLYHADLNVVLYGRDATSQNGSAGAAIAESLRRQKLFPDPRAWDFLSIALSVTAADLAGHRDKSSDGWTREFALDIAVGDAEFWATQIPVLQELLQFLTTDRWQVRFVANGGVPPASDQDPVRLAEDCIVLLSGGLDSFTGALDLAADGKRPFAVSQSVRGDAETQRLLASAINSGIRHMQLNHNTDLPDPENPPSQRARSLVFFSYGILAGTVLAQYASGGEVTLYVCENGFITVNPPLTPARLGSLSTRTSHPAVLALLQRLLDSAGLRIRLENPYRHMTKGEMLKECREQSLLQQYAHRTTSCGRFKRFGYKHCGRCVPCLIRRAAFRAWDVPDKTEYVYKDLSKDDADHARSDDVRASLMAIAEIRETGFDQWLGVTLSSPFLETEAGQFRSVVERGIAELGSLFKAFRIR